MDRLLQPKYCDICGSALNLINIKKLRDGNCCKDCVGKLSPFFNERKQATVSDVRNQLLCREKNKEKLSKFNVTRTVGTKTKVLVDEGKGQFVVTTSRNFKNENADVIDCLSITNCSVDIEESRKEIKYQDSNGNIKSFNPPSYAYAYNFHIEILVNIPYIDVIRFKINDTPVDNGQQTLVKTEGGLLSILTDALLPAKSNNGKTSNADEVRACTEYRKYEQIANEIQRVLLEQRHVLQSHREGRIEKVVCPWCGTKIIPNDSGICERCGGQLDD